VNFLVYRHGKIGFPETHHANEGVYFRALEADVDMYFTDKGFIYPLSGTGPEIADVVSGRIPLANLRNASFNMSAFVITKEGSINQTDIFKNNSGPEASSWTVDFHILPKGSKATYVMCANDMTRDILLGALAAWKDEKKFQKDTDDMSACENYPIRWFTVEEVIARLNELYPDPPKNADVNWSDLDKPIAPRSNL
jgi:hypothetical protein